MILAIDPGNEESAYVLWDGQKVKGAETVQNGVLRDILRSFRISIPSVQPCVIEMIGHYGTGMPAGKTVFDTCVWIGRFMETFGPERTKLILRPTVKAHICGSARAKDPNVRQALIDRLGPPGTKKQQGATYGISGDMWSALAVALTYADQHPAEPTNNPV